MLYTRIVFVALSLFFATLSAKSGNDTESPYLIKKNTAIQLVVNGKPFLMLGGELGNSSASSLDDINRIFPKLEKMGLNTVLVPACWELIEKEEGKYDYSIIDGAIDRARKNNLKIIFLWFGSWKNSMSCYAPLWIKENPKKYPRAVTKSGKPLEMMTAFSESNLNVDKRVFSHFLNHLAEYDKKDQTVIMIQVENEIGMLEDAREYGKIADQRFNSEVPGKFIEYLKKNKKNLQPSLLKKWEANGFKTKGSWSVIFGEGLDTDELFMAYVYAEYVQQIAKAGKEKYNIPMYLNTALNSRGRKPGAYPSAGPLAHLLDVWRFAAPSIDILAPDIYDPGFANWCKQYHNNGNPLFIPEIRLEEANAARVFYAFGEHDAMGFSPFSIEDVADPENYPLTKSYSILHQLYPILTEKQGLGKTNGVLFDNESRERTIERNNYKFIFKHDNTLGWSPKAKDGSIWPEVGALIIELSPTEYIVAGTGVVLSFETLDNKKKAGIGYIDKIKIENGKLIPIRRLNGDQSHQGRHLRIPVGEWDIQYVKLYEY
jgi:hypothetical protein